MRYQSLAILLVLLLFTAFSPCCLAEPGGMTFAPIEQLTTMRATKVPSGRRTPHVVESLEEARKVFTKDFVKTLGKLGVDWDNQYVLAFSWSGSGQDKLEYTVAESLPEQVTFKAIPGHTLDLRLHSHVYALRKGVTWEFAD